ncbi:MAG: tripartite tricarboxylate transporter substrate binding protein [Hydrogenophaga sp.]|jgi:tripartite-type tricarboxylate transporter receptor subunit TctC|uniref:Bug family tripartite tricarboxylate transporter substrate binding protein n=1 Tax=Hydrogenophaga sp. TaxID=1904254 RepID=UPI001DBBD6FA|nr:tripartite tricarboxylate transporter substrate binding protein [Hydrogenophaga sp.]MBW0172350.1 tripartite tricarboxylate transporter substrate binding protein [Hydrogenophaga sp.]MBW0182721.1 tripartite tricarboxylate transporter substrate binding protein [Hydrogenophaga sp.]
MKRRHLLQAAGATLAVPQLALAQSYPAKAMRYIVPVAAGGGSDMIARVVTERWGKALGQGFVVDNQSGGGGVVACQLTARAPADGYTLLQGYVATHGTTPATRRVNYDAVTDFTPIGMIGATPNVLAINANVPARDIKEFIDYVKRQPGKLSYGSAGQGSLTHLTMELLKQETGMFLLHIPYRGIAPAINDLLGGQTQAIFPGLAAALPHLRSGRMRALAVTGRQRSPQLKDVPTMEEVGFKGFDAMQWYGVVGPAGMPPDIVRRLNETQIAVLKAPELAEKLSGEAVEPWPMTPEQFGQYIKADVARWTALAKARNIRLDE